MKHIGEYDKLDRKQLERGSIDLANHRELDHFLQQMTPKERDTALSKIADHSVHWIANPDQSESLLAMYFSVVDEIADKAFAEVPISCKKGCNHCCAINVDINEAEANLIYRKHKEKIDWKKLKFQSKKSLNDFKYLDVKSRECVFLQDGECSIYADRPIACRAYYVTTPPKYCNIINKKLRSKVQRALNEAIESIRAVFFTVGGYTDVGPMPKMLLSQEAKQSTQSGGAHHNEA